MKRVCTWLATVSTILLAGCGGPSGGGSITIDQRVAAYGVGKEGISFAIFTDIDSPNTETRSAGKSGVFASKQTGAIAPASGPNIDYEAGSDSLTIGGGEYAFEKGRVFLAATREGKLDIRQLNIPIEPTSLSSQAFRGEMRRLAKTSEVGVFTGRSGQEAR